MSLDSGEGEAVRIVKDLEYARVGGTGLLLDLYLPVAPTRTLSRR